MSSFIPAYLIQGMPGYVARTYPTVEEAIGWIHDAAGVAVWAHPFWDIESDDEVLAAIERYLAAGLDGGRSSIPRTPRARRACWRSAAPSSACSATGSSDYHGPEHRLLSRFRAHELHGFEPNLGPIGHGTLAAPTRDGGGLCFWLTGLSGSGKSTVGRQGRDRLRDLGHPVTRSTSQPPCAPEPLRRARLQPRGPRDQQPLDRLSPTCSRATA